jgi:hypothetical protein
MGQLRKIRILVRNPQHEARDGQREHDDGDFEHGGSPLPDIGRGFARASRWRSPPFNRHKD